MCLKRIYGLILCFILSSGGLIAQTDSILFPFISTPILEEVPGKYFLDTSPYALIIDEQGTPVYQKQFLGNIRNFTPLNDTSFAVYSAQLKSFLLLDAQMLPTDTVQMDDNYDVDFHHISLHENGNLILLGRELRNIDMSTTVWAGSPNATIVGAVIQEFDQEKNLLYEWKSLDHLGIGDTLTCLVDPLALSIDYIHVNSIQPDTDSTWIISCRNRDQVLKIHKQKGTILWRLGGEGNQFKFINDSIGFSAQHSVHLHENGDLSLFDNGNCKAEKKSRALVYSLNQEEMTITLLKELYHIPPVYAPLMGNHELLPGEQSLVGWGRNRDRLVFTHFLEGSELLEMVFKEQYALYPYAVYHTNWHSPIEITNSDPLDPAVVQLGDSLSLELEFHNTTNYRATPVGLHIEGVKAEFENTYTTPLEPNETGLIKLRCITDKTGSIDERLTIYFSYGDENFSPFAGSQIDIHIQVLGPSGIANRYDETAGIMVYPNPVTNMLILDLEESAQNLAVYSIDGMMQILWGQKDAGTYEISVAELAEGTYYILGISQSGAFITGRFIKTD